LAQVSAAAAGNDISTIYVCTFSQRFATDIGFAITQNHFIHVVFI
jgi:hypothetical protein